MPSIFLSNGKAIAASANESVLDASLRAGITLSYSCRTGRCGACRAQILSGSTQVLQHEIGLSDTERQAGWMLTCAREATSDLELDLEDLSALGLQSARTLPCRIQTMERLAPDVLRIELRLPPGSNFGYASGQYIDVIGPGGIRRSYSVANAPSLDQLIELHVRQVDAGAMSDYWFKHAKVNDLLRLNGPLGTFVLRETENIDIAFIATGTGIAPVKAMLEGLRSASTGMRPRSVRVYWGGRQPEDLYWNPAILVDDLAYRPVLSRAGATWSGRRGYVQCALMDELPSVENLAVYACGSEAMIRDAKAALLSAGLPARRFYSDAFVCSAAV